MTALLLVLAQLLDLALWSRAPHLETNLAPSLADPAEVVALKSVGVAAIVAGAAVLARRGQPVAGRAILLVGAWVGLAGALSAAVVVL